MRKLLLINLCLLLAVSVAQAAAGGTGGNFLLLGGGARGLAMGSAQVALAEDSTAVFWNPAGLARADFPDLNYTHDQWYVDVNHQYFGVAYPTDNGTFGGSYSLLDSGDIQGYSATGSPESVFRTQDSALSFSWARKMNERLSVGVNLKTISESLENTQATSLALDLGVLFDLTSKVRFGAAVQNVGQSLRFITEQTPLPLTLRAGFSVRNRVFTDDRLNLAADYVDDSNVPALNFGAEYVFRDLLAVRAGISKSALRAGVGVKAAYFGLDYAYLSHDDLGAAHQVSLSYSFGSRDTKRAMILDYMALAKAYYNKGRYAEAVVETNKALALDPQDADARALLTKATRALEGGAAGSVEEEVRAEKETEVNAYLEAGRKFMAEAQYLEAITEYNKALRILPSHPETVSLIRQAQAKLEAEVSETVKSEAKAHLGLALKYIATDNYAEALREVDEVLKIDPGNVEALKLYKKLKKLMEIEEQK